MSDRETSAGSAVDPRLKGWKEIASHLGRSVGTVQRWERRFALPVHRIGDGKGDIIFALPDELDAWFRARARRLGEDLPGPAAHDAVTAGGPVNGAATTGAAPDGAPGPDTQDPVRSRPARHRRVGAVAVGLALLAVVGAVGWVAGRGWRLTGRPESSATPGADPSGGTTGALTGPNLEEPVDWYMEPAALVVLGPAGNMLFRYPIEGRTGEVTGYPRPPRSAALPSEVVFDDIDRDGHAEVLLVVRAVLLPEKARLVCLDRHGTERWAYRFAGRESVTFGGKRYGGPFVPYSLNVTVDAAGNKRIWCASTHQSDFPTVLQRLDITGHPVGEYWSNGFICRVAEASVGGRQVLVVGAADNEHKCGSVALLDPERPFGSAPAARRKYSCDDCPQERPLAFVVLPRPARLRVNDYTSAFLRISGEAPDSLYVEVAHAVGDNPKPWEVVGQYVLDGNLVPKRVDLPTSFSDTIRLAEAEGKARPAGPPDRRELSPLLLWRGTAFVPVTPSEATR